METKDAQDDIRSKGTALLQQHLEHKYKRTSTERYLQKAHKTTMEFKKQHQDIRIVRTDKTNKVAIIPNVSYEEKMSQLLNDTNTYERFNSSDKPVTRLMNQNYRLITKLKKAGHVTESEAYQLINTAPTAPRIYGVLKDHKPDALLRPVVSTINSPLRRTF